MLESFNYKFSFYILLCLTKWLVQAILSLIIFLYLIK